VCARIDLDRGETRLFSGPAYNVAPDDSCAIGFPLELMDATQLGYRRSVEGSVASAGPARGASKTQGLWRTDLRSNRKTLLVSLEQLALRVPEPPRGKAERGIYGTRSTTIRNANPSDLPNSVPQRGGIHQ